MAFWNESGLEPKRAYRWRIQLGGLAGEGYLWYAKKVGKPSLSITEHAHKYLNHTFYYPGKVEWSEISVQLVDPVDPDVGATIADLLQQCGYNVPGSAEVVQTVSKGNSVGALGVVFIEQIDSAGTPIETWTLTNAWIKEAKWGELDYDGEDLTMIDLTLRYDFATISTANDSASGGGSTFFSVSGA